LVSISVRYRLGIDFDIFQEKFLLPDDDPAIASYLEHLQGEREAQRKKAEEQSGESKTPGWLALHMQIAEKRV
jgi:hypothetical protein